MAHGMLLTCAPLLQIGAVGKQWWVSEQESEPTLSASPAQWAVQWAHTWQMAQGKKQEGIVLTCGDQYFVIKVTQYLTVPLF